MKNRFSIAIAVLIAAMLAACTMPSSIVREYNDTIILNMAVIPPSGSGSFDLEVTYQAIYTQTRSPAHIYCNYVTPDMATMPIGSIAPFSWQSD